MLPSLAKYLLGPNQTFGTRIYPALDQVDNDKLYLVFVGDTITNLDRVNYYHEMLNKTFATLKSNDKGFVYKVEPFEKNIAISDVKAFQSRFVTETGFIDTSLISVVFKAGRMIEKLKIGNDSIPGKILFGLRFYPAVNSDRKLYFVSKVEAIDMRRPTIRRTILSRTWYNHMDECPTACPINGIRN